MNNPKASRHPKAPQETESKTEPLQELDLEELAEVHGGYHHNPEQALSDLLTNLG